MKNLIFALILTLSVVLITNAYRLKTKDALREQLLDYLLEGEERRNSYYQSRSEFKKQLQRYAEDLMDNNNNNNNDDENSDDDYERTHVRRKAVGLGDNPYK